MELQAQWIAGFVDGEGCFSVTINKSDFMKIGYQVLPEFVVVQHERDIKLLYALKAHFKCGVVRKNHGDRQCYRVRELKSLKNEIIPFFEKHSLKTSKNVDFLKFRHIINIMVEKKHLTIEGLDEIKTIISKMNNRGKKRNDNIL